MKDDNSDGIYACKLPNNVTDVVFQRLNPSTNEQWNKTMDLKIPSIEDKIYLITDWSDGMWIESVSLIGIGGWDSSNDKMMTINNEFIYKIENISLSQDNQFKVRFNKDWGRSYGYDKLENKSSTLFDKTNDGNIKIKANGTYTIIFDLRTEKINIVKH